MAGLGELMQGGPEGMGLPPMSGPDEGEMGPAPQEGMPMEEAIAVMERHQITPDAFPEVAMAVMTIVQAQGGGEGEAPPEEMPPEEGMPPEMAAA